MRVMYDGVNSLAHGIAQQFPHAEIVAGYVDGEYAWSADEWALFPNASKVEISVNAANKTGDVLDVERGDATPAQAHDWIIARREAGYDVPTIYCNYSTVPAVRLETRELRLNVDYDIWVARYDGTQNPPPVPGTPASYAAKQYSAASGYDVSAVYDDRWPRRKGAPQLPAPAGLSGTAWEFLNLTWAAVPGAESYLVEVQPAHGPAHLETVPAADFHGQGHWQTKAFGPGPCMWRVQAQPNGTWTPWQQS